MKGRSAGAMQEKGVVTHGGQSCMKGTFRLLVVVEKNCSGRNEKIGVRFQFMKIKHILDKS